MKKLALIILCVVTTACGPKVGPKNLRNDAILYNEAVQRSTDKQLLMNIVRLRYRDTPTFLDIGIVTSSYDFKRSLNVRADINSPQSVGEPSTYIPTIGVDYSERPTTTYQPLQGQGYVTKMLSPMSFQTLNVLNSSGWRIDRLLRCCVQRMNNVRNAPSASGPTPDIAPCYRDFIELSNIFRELEICDAVQVVTKHVPDREKPVFIITLDDNPEYLNLYTRLWELLELDPGTTEIYLTHFHGKKHLGNEVMIDTRSPLSLLYFLSQGVNVPIYDELYGSVTITYDEYGQPFDWNQVLDGIITIHSGNKCDNCHSSVSVCYRGRVFYIDDTDLSSKATFSLVSQVMALQTGCPDLPIYTIPLVQP